MDRERAKIELREHLKDYLETKHGIDTSKNFRCLNPQHEDKNPSMGFDAAHNQAHCFSCNENYDILDLIRQDYNCDFNEALEIGCQMYHIQIDKQPKHGAAQTNSAPMKTNAVTQPKEKPSLEDLKREFDAAQPATNAHPYLQRKHVRTDTTLKVNHAGELLISLQDVDGNFRGYQRIAAEPTKKTDKDTGREVEKWLKFQAKGTVQTGAFHIIGGGELQQGDTVVLAEGYATAFSVWECIRDKARIVFALNCGNLFEVARAIHNKYDIKPFIAADIDKSGRDAAAKCREDICSGHVLPPFDKFHQLGFNDWNDYFDEYKLADTQRALIDGLSKPEFLPVDEEELAASAASEVEEIKQESIARPWIMSARDLITNFQPTEWLIEDWIPENSQILLFGASGAGKSFVTLDMAASIACSDITEWHGLNIEHGDVLYLCGEGHNGLTKRLIGWAQARGVNLDNINLYITQQPKLITDSKVTDWIINEVKALNLQNLKLIIIDTLSRHFGEDENNASAATNFLNQILAIQAEFNCAALITHHTGVADDAKNRGRGSSAFKGAVDMELQIKSEGSGADFYVTLSQTKNKDDELKEALTFKRVSIALTDVPEIRSGKQLFTAVLERVDAQAVQVAAKKPEGYTAKIEVVLKAYVAAAQAEPVFNNGGETFYGVRKEIWREELYKRSTSDNADTKRRGFNRTLNDLGKLEVLFADDDDGNKKGNIYYPAANFKEFIEAAGLTSKVEQIALTSRGEVI